MCNYRMQGNRRGENKMANEITGRGEILLYSDENGKEFVSVVFKDEQLMSMQDWLNETDRFLVNNRRKVLDGKGYISRDAAVKKVGAIYEEFRKKQDAEYVSEFDRHIAKYLKGE